MTKSWFYIIFLIFLGCQHVPARKSEDIYVQAKTFARRPSVSLQISTVENERTAAIETAGLAETETVTFEPDTSFANGNAVSVFGIGISGMQKTDRDSLDGTERTIYTDTQLHVNGDSTGFDFYRQSYQGFTLQNSERFYPGEPSHYLSDLKMQVEGFNIYFVNRPESFSFQSAFDQSFKPAKSGISFISMLSGTRIHFESETSIIPETQQVFYGKDVDIRSGTIYSASGLMGGGFVVAGKNNIEWNFVLLAGPAAQTQRFDGYENESELVRLSTRLHFRTSISYDLDYLFLYGMFQYDYFQAASQSVNFNPASGFAELGVGVRI